VAGVVNSGLLEGAGVLVPPVLVPAVAVGRGVGVAVVACSVGRGVGVAVARSVGVGLGEGERDGDADGDGDPEGEPDGLADGEGEVATATVVGRSSQPAASMSAATPNPPSHLGCRMGDRLLANLDCRRPAPRPVGPSHYSPPGLSGLAPKV
jgi:hypothetical protein